MLDVDEADDADDDMHHNIVVTIRIVSTDCTFDLDILWSWI